MANQPAETERSEASVSTGAEDSLSRAPSPSRGQSPSYLAETRDDPDPSPSRNQRPSYPSGAEDNRAASPSRGQTLSYPSGAGDNRAAREHFEAGRLAQDQGRPGQAMIEYRRALKLDPNLSGAYLNLGNIFLTVYQDPERARDMYQQALKFDPDNKLGHNNLGVIYLKQDRLDQAEAEFRAAVKQDPKYADALYNLACVFARKDQPTQAVAQLEKAARIDPGIGRSAADDPDLASLRGRPDFARLLKAGQTKPAKD